MFVATYIALWVLVCLLVVAVFALYHHVGTQYVRSRAGREDMGPEVGSEFVTPSTRGTPTDEPSPKLVVFGSPTCDPCRELLPELQLLDERHPGLELTVVSRGDLSGTDDWTRELGPSVNVIPDPRGEVFEKYDIFVTPFLLAIDRTNTIRMKGIAGDRSHLDLFAYEALGTGLPEPIALALGGRS